MDSQTKKILLIGIAAATAVLGVVGVSLKSCSDVVTDSDGGVDSGTDGDADVDADSDTDADSDPPEPVCGNSKVEAGEECDDGNVVNNDGCSSTCSSEPALPVCGNGTLEAGEQCDDGNQSNTDSCLNTCLNNTCGDGFLQNGAEQCDDGNVSNTDSCLIDCNLAKCGDGHIRTGSEQCDDGNNVNTDTCLNSCVSARCGDGVVISGVEACDDGNGSNSDACLNTCATSSCGDGFVRTGTEVCDDGNQSNTDSCTNSCSAARCGDGFVRIGTEACDDGNSTNTDSCLNTCSAARCGDGVVRSGTETCDDGNQSNVDSCLNSCASARCGDGFVQNGVESCEPPNSAVCSSSCQTVVSPPSTGGPVVLYTDMLSAPAGAWVTIWGRRFGTSGTVVFGGSSSTTSFSWSEQMVVYQIPAGTAVGSYTVQLRTSSGTLSNSLPLSVHQGTVRFVTSTSGVLAGLSSLTTGDVLYFRAGNYTTNTIFNSVVSWNNTSVTGTQSRPLALVAYPGETVVLGDNSLERGIYTERPSSVPNLDYVTYSKFTVRGRCLAFQVGGRSHNGRIVGNDMWGQGGSGCVDGAIALQGNSGWKIIGNTLHDNSSNASKYNHGIYLAGFGTNSNIEIAWNVIRNHRGGRGIQFYGHVANDSITNVRVHDNELYGVDRDGILLGSSDGGTMGLSDVQVYNNIIYRAGRCVGFGLRVQNPTATNIEVYNNTFVDNGGGYNSCAEAAAGTREAQVGLQSLNALNFRNNILSSVGSERLIDVAAGAFVRRNLYNGTATVPSGDTMAIQGNPLFVNEATNDYRLSASSPALNAATSLSPIVLSVDHDAFSRPFGTTSDLGVYERQQ